MTKDEIVQVTLEWCNARREEQNLPPLAVLPKGVIRSPKSCPCGEASNLRVFKKNYWPSSAEGEIGKLPWVVSEFVRLFDKGKFPEYVMKKGVS